MNIRTVNVEFLRAGPRHNQLLSPLTQYLAVCGDSPAGVVNLPYEQAVFERQRQELRYAVHTDDESERRSGVLDQTGREMAQILGDVPGLPGTLSSFGDSSDIVHLRIVISASELALLPFELSKLPIRTGIPSNEWLQIHTQVPVCLTRHIRSVSSERVLWPRRPRILFVTGPDVGTHESDHLEALTGVVRPWTNDDKKIIPDWLTSVKGASIEQIAEATKKQDFTHVHILAHGAPFEGKQERFGVSLKDRVVSGRELAQALISVTDKIHAPTVITLATCDSAAQASVVRPDVVSVAHDLHDAGIPLVVASQFPLSTGGALPFVKSFYDDQLRGVHPLISLYRIRLALFTSGGQQCHDWASLVVYEALPSNLQDQLQEVQYWQMRRWLEVTLTRLENAAAKTCSFAPKEFTTLDEQLKTVHEQLPQAGPYQAECLGTRAASWKRRAEVEFQRAKDSKDDKDRQLLAKACYEYLENALADYQKGANAFHGAGDQPGQKVATLHWLLAQVVSLNSVLGKPFRLELWMAALFSGKTELEVLGRGSLWGHGTVAELYLIRLTDPDLSEEDRKEAIEEALRHVTRVVELNGLMSEQVRSTRRQFERYVNWWSDPVFAKMLEPFRVAHKTHWYGHGGLVETAKRIMKILDAGIAAPERTGDFDQPEPKPADLAPLHVAANDEMLMSAPRQTLAPGIDGGRMSPAMIFDIEMLPAENGDCLWVEYGDQKSPRRIILDCGAKSAAKSLVAKVAQLEPTKRNFELFVLTHIDSDHISGVPEFFEQLPKGTSFREIWFNGWKQLPYDKLGVAQAEEFSEMLKAPELKASWNRSFGAGEWPLPVELMEGGDPRTVSLAGGMNITVLSPGSEQLRNLASKWREGLQELHPDKNAKEFLAGAPPDKVKNFETFDVKALANTAEPPDHSVANGSSIALLLEYGGTAALMLGDAYAPVVANSIQRLMKMRGAEGRKLRLDAIKLSHHGSKNALTRELLSLVECPKYLISTNGTKFYHPDREAIAKVIIWGGATPSLYFNYVSKFNELWQNSLLKKKFQYNAVYPAGAPGLRVNLRGERKESRPPRRKAAKAGAR